MIVGIISTIVILTIGIIEIIRRYPEEIIDSNTEVFSESQFKPDHSYRNIDLYKKEN